MTTPSLFPRPDQDIPRLSTQFGRGEHRAAPGDLVKWTRRKLRGRADCDECTALQHETKGAYWPRRQVRLRRTVNGGSPLDLCSAHGAAWKDRDALDGAN